MPRFFRFLVFSLLALTSGCTDSLVVGEGNGLGPSKCMQSSWLRSTNAGTEVIFLGAPADDPTAVSEGSCMARAFVERDSSTTIELGTYVLDEKGAGSFEVETVFELPYEPELGVFDRVGATRQDLDPPGTHGLSIAVAGGKLDVTLNGETRRLTGAREVVARLDPVDQEGAEDVVRVIGLTRATARARILALESVGTTMYLDNATRFAGLSRGSYEFDQSSVVPIVQELSYASLAELESVTLDGTETTELDLTGDGTMSGRVEFWLNPGTDAVRRGSITFDDVILENAVEAGGSYTLELEGSAHSPMVDWCIMRDLDLTKNGLLPIEAP